jgi:hypothetical protein
MRATSGAQLEAVVLGVCFKSGRGSPALCHEVEALAKEKLAAFDAFDRRASRRGGTVEQKADRDSRRAAALGLRRFI